MVGGVKGEVGVGGENGVRERESGCLVTVGYKSHTYFTVGMLFPRWALVNAAK